MGFESLTQQKMSFRSARMGRTHEIVMRAGWLAYKTLLGRAYGMPTFFGTLVQYTTHQPACQVFFFTGDAKCKL